MAVYLGWLGLWFAATVLVPGQVADMRLDVHHVALGAILVIPLMTMSLLADEYASGRIEMLRTSPITDFQILMEDLGAGVLCHVGLCEPRVRSRPGGFRPAQLRRVISSVHGRAAPGMLAVAIGLFFSSISRYQIVAALLGILTMFVITIGLDVVNFLFIDGASPWPTLRSVGSGTPATTWPFGRTWSSSPRASWRHATSPTLSPRIPVPGPHLPRAGKPQVALGRRLPSRASPP